MDDLQTDRSDRHYIACHDGRRIDVDAESMWPAGACLEFWATVEVIGPRLVCVRRQSSFTAIMDLADPHYACQ